MQYVTTGGRVVDAVRHKAREGCNAPNEERCNALRRGGEVQCTKRRRGVMHWREERCSAPNKERCNAPNKERCNVPIKKEV